MRIIPIGDGMGDPVSKAMELAGEILLAEKSHPGSGYNSVQSARDALITLVMAFSLISNRQDSEKPFFIDSEDQAILEDGGTIEAKSPSDILRTLADGFEEQVGIEHWEPFVEHFCEIFDGFIVQEETKDLNGEKELFVEDILGEKGK